MIKSKETQWSVFKVIRSATIKRICPNGPQQCSLVHMRETRIFILLVFSLGLEEQACFGYMVMAVSFLCLLSITNKGMQLHVGGAC